MSFLDNLENSLKSLENREERDGSEARRRESDQQQARAVAPWAEKLKADPFTRTLMDYAAGAGRRIRSKVYMAWMGDTLRLEAQGKVCQIYPTASGIEARYSRLADGVEQTEPVALEEPPGPLIDRWLGLS